MPIVAWSPRHFPHSSALARVADGRRLVAITAASLAPDSPTWAYAFARLQEREQTIFSAAVDGSVYATHGTTIDTRLTLTNERPRLRIHRSRWEPPRWKAESSAIALFSLSQD
jgi:hypothetical protein